MEVCFTVQEVCGDYAVLRSDEGTVKEVAMFLLPDGVTDGSRLRFANFSYELI